MLHGPCGLLKPSSPCIKDGTCSKHYPHDFSNITIINKNSYPLYHRRDTYKVRKSGKELDNR